MLISLEQNKFKICLIVTSDKVIHAANVNGVVPCSNIVLGIFCKLSLHV